MVILSEVGELGDIDLSRHQFAFLRSYHPAEAQFILRMLTEKAIELDLGLFVLDIGNCTSRMTLLTMASGLTPVRKKAYRIWSQLA